MIVSTESSEKGCLAHLCVSNVSVNNVMLLRTKYGKTLDNAHYECFVPLDFVGSHPAIIRACFELRSVVVKQFDRAGMLHLTRGVMQVLSSRKKVDC